MHIFQPVEYVSTFGFASRRRNGRLLSQLNGYNRAQQNTACTSNILVSLSPEVSRSWHRFVMAPNNDSLWFRKKKPTQAKKPIWFNPFLWARNRKILASDIKSEFYEFCYNERIETCLLAQTVLQFSALLYGSCFRGIYNTSLELETPLPALLGALILLSVLPLLPAAWMFYFFSIPFILRIGLATSMHEVFFILWLVTMKMQQRSIGRTFSEWPGMVDFIFRWTLCIAGLSHPYPFTIIVVFTLPFVLYKKRGEDDHSNVVSFIMRIYGAAVFSLVLGLLGYWEVSHLILYIIMAVVIEAYVSICKQAEQPEPWVPFPDHFTQLVMDIFVLVVFWIEVVTIIRVLSGF